MQGKAALHQALTLEEVQEVVVVKAAQTLLVAMVVEVAVRVDIAVVEAQAARGMSLQDLLALEEVAAVVLEDF